MNTATPDINLLPKEDLEKEPVGKVLKWALTAGRYIVVVTELVVLLAFLSRFKLDRDLSDLSDDIARKKSIIVAMAPFEDKVRKLQNRLSQIDALSKNIPQPEKYLDLFTTTLPSESQITTMQINNTTITIDGVVGSEGGIATLIGALKQSPTVKTVAVNKLVQKQIDHTLSFSVDVEIWP